MKNRVVFSLLSFLAAELAAVPSGSQVAAGSVDISSGEGALRIEQMSDRAIIEWMNFSVGSGEKVEFSQPGAGAAILNRVMGESVSEIHGLLSANGQVFLLNPHGVLIGPEGEVLTNGFIASALSLDNAQFLAGGDLQFLGDSKAEVANLGRIDGGAGDVFLIGAYVRNEGEMISQKGCSAIAGGTDVLIRPSGEERIFVRGTGFAENKGWIEGASVEIRANSGNPYALALKQDGVVRANAIEERDGKIFLRALSGKAEVSGEIEAKGGAIQVVAEEIALNESARISADGKVNGGTVEVIAKEKLLVEGVVSARGGAEEGDGGFIELSGRHLDWKRATDVSAPKGKPGSLLLDPYDVFLALADPGAPASWVDVNGGSPLLVALAGGPVTVSTAMSGGGFFTYDSVGMNYPAMTPPGGNLTVSSTFNVPGAFDLTLIADNDLLVSAAITNSGGGGFDLQAANNITVNALIETQGATGDIRLTTTSGSIFLNDILLTTSVNPGGTGLIDLSSGADIDLGTTGRCIVSNSNSTISFVAGNDILINSANNIGATNALTTLGQAISLTSTAGAITDFNCMISSVGGDFTMQTLGAGDIVITGSATTGQVKLIAGGDLYIGNSAGNLSTVQTNLNEGGMTPSPVDLQGVNIIVRGGTGSNQNVQITGHSTLSLFATTGDISLIGGDGMSSGVDLRSAIMPNVYTVLAPSGSFTLQGGIGDDSNISFGPSGLAGGSGVLNITTGGSVSFLGGTGNNASVDIRGESGAWSIGSDFFLHAGMGAGTGCQINCYMLGGNGMQSMLTVGGRVEGLGGPLQNDGVYMLWQYTQFAITSNVVAMGGSGQNASCVLDMNDQTNSPSSVGGFVLVQGGIGDGANAEVGMNAVGNAPISIGSTVTIQGGTGEDSQATLLAGGVTLDIPSTLTITGVVGYASLDCSVGPSTILVHDSATLSGGAGGMNVQSTGDARIASSDNVQLEVGDTAIPGSGNLSFSAGTGANAGAFFFQFNLSNLAAQTVYTLADIKVNASATTTSSSGIFLVSGPMGGRQIIQAGGDIDLSGAGSSSSNGILGVGFINAMMMVDSPGPDSVLQSLGSITSTNGTGPCGIQNIAVPLPLIAPPPGSFLSTGNVLIEAGGDVTLSSQIIAGSTAGALNLDKTLQIGANTQFPMGILWAGNSFLGVSPASSFPPGQGAVIGNTGALGGTVDLTTFQGNLTVLSANADTAFAPADFILGSAPNDFTITTTSGNILVSGFANINVGQALTTAGNSTLVFPATQQIFLQAVDSVFLNESVTVTGLGFGISINADSDFFGSGLIDQTAGIVTADVLNFSAAQGISNSVLMNMAVQTAGLTISGNNTTVGPLNIENTIAGPNTTNITVSLGNGSGFINNNRPIYFAQRGGTSPFVSFAFADGDISLLAYDGSANLTIDGSVQAGQHMIGMAYNDITLTVNGSVSADQNVTLIVDEMSGAAAGTSMFTNLSTTTGVTSNLVPPNIAVYAVSGPEAPAGLTAPNLITFGNLTTLPTWDASLPDGLASKYSTSWDAGGPYHGAGFGTNYVPGTGVFSSPVVWYKIAATVPPIPPAAVFGFQQEVFQSVSLISDLKMWGEEISFTLTQSTPFWRSLPRYYFLADDAKRQHIAKDSYEKFTRRKFVDAF